MHPPLSFPGDHSIESSPRIEVQAGPPARPGCVDSGWANASGAVANSAIPPDLRRAQLEFVSVLGPNRRIARLGMAALRGRRTEIKAGCSDESCKGGVMESGIERSSVALLQINGEGRLRGERQSEWKGKERKAIAIIVARACGLWKRSRSEEDATAPESHQRVYEKCHCQMSGQYLGHSSSKFETNLKT